MGTKSDFMTVNSFVVFRSLNFENVTPCIVTMEMGLKWAIVVPKGVLGDFWLYFEREKGTIQKSMFA